jgi:hypothetical protein
MPLWLILSQLNERAERFDVVFASESLWLTQGYVVGDTLVLHFVPRGLEDVLQHAIEAVGVET